MRTTVEVPDDLFREAKSSAALQGKSLRELFVEGLRLAIDATKRGTSKPIRVDFPLIKGEPGSLTMEMIKEAEEQEYEAEGEHYGRFVRR